MFLKILAHPIFTQLNFHMPMIVDLSHPVVMLTGENGSGNQPCFIRFTTPSAASRPTVLCTALKKAMSTSKRLSS